MLLGLAAAALGTVAAAGIFWYYGREAEMPNLRSLADYRPQQVSRIADRNGQIIGEMFTERRTFATYDQIPELLVHAFVAAEDADFFQHQGLDYWGMARAMLINLRTGSTRQGASTITQQVVKTFLLTPERTYKRKIQEIILARRLEQALSKEDIITLYLNQIYFGHGRYGVVEAARFYFGKDLGNIHAGEAAMLAGLVQAPENISPKKARSQERAKRRQQYVLEQMVYRGYLEEKEAQKWVDAPIRVVREPFPQLGAAPEWVGVARRELIERYGESQLGIVGGKVITSVDLDIQEAAVRALRSGLRAYDKRHGHGTAVRRIKADKIDLEVAKLARRLPWRGRGKKRQGRKRAPKAGETYLSVVREVIGGKGESSGALVVDLGKWRARLPIGGAMDEERYNPGDKAVRERFAVGDVVRVLVPKKSVGAKEGQRVVQFAPGPEGAVVVLDTRSREVLALVGGFDVGIGDFDRAQQAKRQPGSTFKPLVYAAAIASGRYTAASIVNDAPEVYDLWKPQNYKKGVFAGPVRLREALAKSINTVAIRVLHDIGPETLVDLARRLGIASELPSQLSLALGSGEVTLLELTSAFAAVAGGGVAQPAQLIKRLERMAPAVESRETGGQGAAGEPVGEQVLDPSVAYVVTNMMESVISEGTGAAAARLGLPLAGKTGTSNDARDGWFIGMTPNYVVGVWTGFDDNRPLGKREGGGRTALPVYMELMTQIGKRERSARWTQPADVVTTRIDRQTGLLAAPGSDDERALSEVFVAGTAPRDYAPAPDQDAAADVLTDIYDDAYGDDAYGDDGDTDGAGADGAP